MLKYIILALSFTLSSCAMLGIGGGDAEPQEAVANDSDSGEEAPTESTVASKNSKVVKFGSTLVKSVSNNKLTSRTVDTSQAASLARSMDKKNIKDLIDAVAAERIAGSGTAPVLARAKVLMDKLFTRGIEQDLPDGTKLELGLAAVQTTNLPLARLFLEPLLKSKSGKVKAGAYNALGVLYIKMDEMPDAVLAFNNSLKASPNYPAALFNLGMITLKFGDFGLAKKYLGKIQSDWYAQLGLAVAERQLQRNSQAESLCNRVLQAKGNHKMALFNCGLFFAQNKGDVKRGKAMISKATQFPGGEQGWDEDAFKVLEKLK